MVKSSEELFPTPKKSHYLFNMRDMNKVFIGIGNATHLGVRTDLEMIKLWVHESRRVFQDRLIDQNDQ
jgi:dynein heavy chain, axonemal